MATTFVYGGHPTSVIALTPGPEAVELTITQFTVEGRTTVNCEISLDEFRDLVVDGAAVLTDAKIAEHCVDDIDLD